MGPCPVGLAIATPKQSSAGAAEFKWQVLQCWSLPGHVFNGWFPALVCTGNSPGAPGMDSSCFSHSHAGREMSQESAVCSLIYWERENVLNERGTAGNSVRSQALKLCVLANSLLFCLDPVSPWRARCLLWELEPCSPVPHCFIQTTCTFPQCFHLGFCLPLPRTGRCEPSLSEAASGTACLMEVSLCCFLISKVCQHLIKPTPKCG